MARNRSPKTFLRFQKTVGARQVCVNTNDEDMTLSRVHSRCQFKRMKPIVMLTCLAGVAGWLGAGCDDPRPPATAKKQTTNVVRVAKSRPAPAKPKKEILPGTIDYLDAKNGFRGVTFGQPETSIANL